MTALLASRPAPSGSQAGPGLTPVPPLRRRLSTMWFVVVLAGVLALGMVGVLVLTTALQAQGFALEDKQAEATRLANDLADLEVQVAKARSMESLALAAQHLGMKPDPYPAQLRLSDGAVVGEATPVLGGEMPAVRYRTPEQAAAEEKARVEAEKERAEAAKRKAERAERKAERLAAEKAERKAEKAKNAQQADQTKQTGKKRGSEGGEP